MEDSSKLFPNKDYLEKIRLRFSRYTKRAENGCLEWTGALAVGYGSIRCNYITIYAHRLAWFLYYGEWPKNLICHTCDNKKCCEITHLFDGTYTDNINDAIKKGKKIYRLTIVTKEIGDAILANPNLSNEKLGNQLGISRSTVSRFRNRDFPYRWLKGEI